VSVNFDLPASRELGRSDREHLSPPRLSFLLNDCLHSWIWSLSCSLSQTIVQSSEPSSKRSYPRPRISSANLPRCSSSPSPTRARLVSESPRDGPGRSRRSRRSRRGCTSYDYRYRILHPRREFSRTSSVERATSCFWLDFSPSSSSNLSPMDLFTTQDTTLPSSELRRFTSRRKSTPLSPTLPRSSSLPTSPSLSR